VSVVGQVKEPRLLSSVIPAYPASAKQFNVQGDVQIRTTIDEFGRVKQMKVISGPSLLQRAAMDALRQWKYEPTKLDGKPVPVEIVVTVKFRRQ
jgi:periplasmic protein TonB